MPSFMDYLGQYKSQTQAPEEAPQGTGVQSRNLVAEAGRGQADAAAQAGAIELSTQTQVNQAQAQMQQAQGTAEKEQAMQQRVATKEDYTRSAKGTMTDLNNKMGQIGTQDKIDRMEMAGKDVRLANDKYRFNLDDIGRRQRLDTQIGMKEATRKSIWSEDVGVLQNNYQMQKALDADEGNFQKYIANISIDTAYSLALQDHDIAAMNSMYSGLGSAVSSGAGLAAKYAMDQSRTQGTEAPEEEGPASYMANRPTDGGNTSISRPSTIYNQ